MKRVEPRSLPQQDRSRFTVSTIVEAAERLLASGGRSTTRAVARLAGVSVGTVYQYFPGREAVVAAVIDRRLEADEARILASIESARNAPLQLMIRQLLEELIPRTEWERTLYPRLVDVLDSVERSPSVRRVLERFELLWEVELSKRLPELRAGLTPEVASTVSLYALRTAMLELGRKYPHMPREQVIEELERLALGYLTG